MSQTKEKELDFNIWGLFFFWFYGKTCFYFSAQVTETCVLALFCTSFIGGKILSRGKNSPVSTDSRGWAGNTWNTKSHDDPDATMMNEVFSRLQTAHYMVDVVTSQSDDGYIRRVLTVSLVSDMFCMFYVCSMKGYNLQPTVQSDVAQCQIVGLDSSAWSRWLSRLTVWWCRGFSRSVSISRLQVSFGVVKPQHNKPAELFEGIMGICEIQHEVKKRKKKW